MLDEEQYIYYIVVHIQTWHIEEKKEEEAEEETVVVERHVVVVGESLSRSLSIDRTAAAAATAA